MRRTVIRDKKGSPASSWSTFSPFKPSGNPEGLTDVGRTCRTSHVGPCMQTSAPGSHRVASRSLILTLPLATRGPIETIISWWRTSFFLTSYQKVNKGVKAKKQNKTKKESTGKSRRKLTSAPHGYSGVLVCWVVRVDAIFPRPFASFLLPLSSSRPFFFLLQLATPFSATLLASSFALPPLPQPAQPYGDCADWFVRWGDLKEQN